MVQGRGAGCRARAPTSRARKQEQTPPALSASTAPAAPRPTLEESAESAATSRLLNAEPPTPSAARVRSGVAWQRVPHARVFPHASRRRKKKPASTGAVCQPAAQRSSAPRSASPRQNATQPARTAPPPAPSGPASTRTPCPPLSGGARCAPSRRWPSGGGRCGVPVPIGAVLNLRTTPWQKCEAVPRRARI